MKTSRNSTRASSTFTTPTRKASSRSVPGHRCVVANCLRPPTGCTVEAIRLQIASCGRKAARQTAGSAAMNAVCSSRIRARVVPNARARARASRGEIAGGSASERQGVRPRAAHAPASVRAAAGGAFLPVCGVAAGRIVMSCGRRGAAGAGAAMAAGGGDEGDYLPPGLLPQGGDGAGPPPGRVRGRQGAPRAPARVWEEGAGGGAGEGRNRK